MKFINQKFNEFKSIFVSDDLLKENEEHANIVTASTMFNVFWICVITWALVYFNVFKLGMDTMNSVLLRSIVLLVVPAIICFRLHGKGSWLKHVLFISFAFMLAMADAMLKYNVTLIMVIPVILAARYYNKKFTISVAVLTSIIFIISAYMSVNIGQQDLNSYNLVIREGTTITVETTLRDAISKIDVDEAQRLKNIFIHFFLPKILIFNIIAFACAQISQSGKNMIEKQKEITESSQRIETELHLANAIQHSMLPSIFPPFPEHNEIDIFATMIPAKEVGGDFYDMFLIDENHLAMCVADVSGKGVPASLVMMISKILIKNVTKIDMDVDKSFTRVNNMLCEGNETGIFITSWFGILDLRNGHIDYVNAGHNPPLIYSKKNNKFTYLESKPNLVLAGLEGTNYTKNEITIEAGDKVFLYTDGVTEATNSNKELYGEERLINFLNKNTGLSVEETIGEVKIDIDSFVGDAEQFDDITMLELLYKGKTDTKKDNSKKNKYAVEKEFKADKKELDNVQEYVLKELNNLKCDSKTINDINLAIEEVFVNIASYAYNDKEGTCTLKINYNGKDTIDFVFKDSGVKFNPLENKEPDTTLGVEERSIGGLGIFLTKKVMDKVEYKYKNNKNILTISKKI